MNTQQNINKKTGIKLLVGFFILLGVITTLGHYFMPTPDAAMKATELQSTAPNWVIDQLPRYDLIPITTFLHLAPAALFMLLLGFQLSHSFRNKHPQLHRINGRVLALLAFIFTVSGFILGIKIPFGGNIEMVTSTLVSIAFLYALYQGIRYAKKKNFEQHRYWMLRMVAISFTPLTMRLIMVPIEALQLIDMHLIFGALLFISMVVNIFILEVFILKNRYKITLRVNKLNTTKVAN